MVDIPKMLEFYGTHGCPVSKFLLEHGKPLVRLAFSATLWCAVGTFIGWHIGNDGGFRRGVHLTAKMVTDILQKKDDGGDIPPPRKYTDL